MKKIIFIFICFIGPIGLMDAQNSITAIDNNGTEDTETIASLIDRFQNIGVITGSINEYFTQQELRQINVHYNGIQNLAPVVLTQSATQNIDPLTTIACASASFKDNNLFRVFDLAGDFGIMNGLEVNAVEFAIGQIATPSGFPITANIYSTEHGSFPDGGAPLTLEGTAVYIATSPDALTMITLPLVANIPPGKDMVMELVLVDDGRDVDYMRFGCNSDGETGPSYLLAPDCGIFEITTLSDLGLNYGYVWNVLGDDGPVTPPVPAVAYGILNNLSSLVSFNPTDTSVLTTVGTSPGAAETAGAIDPNDNTSAYTLSHSEFYHVNLETGVYTLLGNLQPDGEWQGLEFDPISGSLYAISSNAQYSTLYIIDVDSVTATLVGTALVPYATSLMIDYNGDAYFHNIGPSNFYYINLANGEASLIGTLGFIANFAQGGTYVKGDPGFVYLSAMNSTVGQSQWRRVDVNTGLSTVVGLFNGGTQPMGWVSSKGELLGVAENALEGFTYYPNPTSGVLSLKSVNNIDLIAIYNLLGQRVLAQKIDATTTDLDISGLTSGAYIMKVIVNGQISTYKVLKK